MDKRKKPLHPSGIATAEIVEGRGGHFSFYTCFSFHIQIAIMYVPNWFNEPLSLDVKLQMS